MYSGHLEGNERVLGQILLAILEASSITHDNHSSPLGHVTDASLIQQGQRHVGDQGTGTDDLFNSPAGSFIQAGQPAEFHFWQVLLSVPGKNSKANLASDILDKVNIATTMLAIVGLAEITAIDDQGHLSFILPDGTLDGSYHFLVNRPTHGDGNLIGLGTAAMNHFAPSATATLMFGLYHGAGEGEQGNSSAQE